MERSDIRGNLTRISLRSIRATQLPKLGNAFVGRCPPRCSLPKVEPAVITWPCRDTPRDRDGGRLTGGRYASQDIVRVAAARRDSAAWCVAGACTARASHRLHRAEDRHLLAARHRHAERLPDVSGREQGRARRRQGQSDRRGRPGPAGHRRHQGQQAHPVGQGAHAGRRRAGDDGLRAGAGRHAGEDALHRLDRDRRRSRAARLRQISLHGAADLRAVAARASARAMGLRAGLQADQPASLPTMRSATRRPAASRRRSRIAAGRSCRRSGRRSAPRTSGPTSRPSRATSTPSSR